MFQHFPEAWRADELVLREAIRLAGPEVFADAAQDFKNNRALVLDLLQNKVISFKHLDNDLKENKAFILDALEVHYRLNFDDIQQNYGMIRI